MFAVQSGKSCTFPMPDPIWDGKNPHLGIVSGSFGKEWQECRQAGYVIASHVSLALLAGRLKKPVSMFCIERWCFWTRSISVKKVKIGMQDDNSIADISCEFGEFRKTNGRVIAQRIIPLLPARLLFWVLSGENCSVWAGPWGAL